jgi:hypothetical protein
MTSADFCSTYQPALLLIVPIEYRRVRWLLYPFPDSPQSDSLSISTLPSSRSPQIRTVNCLYTTAPFTVPPEPKGFVMVCITYPGGFSLLWRFCSSARRFAAGFRYYPSSRKRPCLKLVVIVTRICNLIIWTLVLRQGTFTP